MMATDNPQDSSVKIGLVGLAIGLVWVFVVGAFAYWLAQ